MLALRVWGNGALSGPSAPLWERTPGVMGLLQEGLYAEGWSQVQAGLLAHSGGKPQTQASRVESESQSQGKDPKQALGVTMQREVSNHARQPAGK